MNKKTVNKTKKKAKPKGRMGRPPKKDKVNWEAVELLYQRGFIDKEVCKIVGISESTLNRWKQKHPDLWESIKGWKVTADDKVEKALFLRAIGYEHDDTYITQHQGKILTKKITKHYPPDTAAAFIWLKNRKSKDWQDKIGLEHSGDIIVNFHGLSKPMGVNKNKE